MKYVSVLEKLNFPRYIQLSVTNQIFIQTSTVLEEKLSFKCKFVFKGLVYAIIKINLALSKSVLELPSYFLYGNTRHFEISNFEVESRFVSLTYI